ncbi:hypothetical protein ACWKWU_19260 [Chitinophaga lutea]
MRLLPQVVIVFCIAFLLLACTNVKQAFQPKERVYQPPRIGAEHRFEDGLRKEKHPQQLFSPKEQKDMEKSGRMTARQRTAPATRISPMQADSLLTGKTRDTTQAAPADSVQAPPADTAQKNANLR